MDNTENNSWDEISNDVSEVKKKIKDKVVSENSIDDLKDSFQLTIENSKEILKNLIAAVDETVKDEEIRSETREIIKKRLAHTDSVMCIAASIYNNIIIIFIIILIIIIIILIL